MPPPKFMQEDMMNRTARVFGSDGSRRPGHAGERVAQVAAIRFQGARGAERPAGSTAAAAV